LDIVVTIERSTPSQQSTLGGGVLKLLLFVNKLGHSVIYYYVAFDAATNYRSTVQSRLHGVYYDRLI
jgi:hypothetical protein